MGEKKEDENLIAYCGLYCGDCHAYKRVIPELALRLRKELRESKYERFAQLISKYPFGADFKDFDKCYKVLGAMMKFQCEKGCRGGGGSESCKIRLCCQEKGINGCWECEDFRFCKKLDVLIPLHDNAHIENLKAIRKKGKEEFLKGERLW